MNYGDISPRTAGKAVKKLLTRALPILVLEQFAQPFVLSKNETKTAKFRRYEALAATPVALTEGVTPAGKTLTKTDVTVTLVQYGDYIDITDVILDTHEDPVLNESIDILGEQAGEMLEIARFNVLKAGTAVYYANGVNRLAVNSILTKALQQKVIRGLKRQNARKITTVVKSTPNFNTENVAAGYIGLVHPDVSTDVQKMAGFVPIENYGSNIKAYESEIGKVGDVRYIEATIIEPWADAGGLAVTNTTVTTTGTNSDVYPVLYLARDAFGAVMLKGSKSIAPLVSNPRPGPSDQLAQKGSVGWKAMSATVILNDMFMARAEVAAGEL